VAKQASDTKGVYIDLADLSGLWWRPGRVQQPPVDRLYPSLHSRSRERRYASGTVIHDGSGVCRLLLVDQGVATVVHVGPSGTEVVLAVLTAGHSFCSCDLDTLPSCAVVAFTDVTCTILEGRDALAAADSLGHGCAALVRVVRDGLFFACLLSARDRVWRLLSFAQALAHCRAPAAVPVPFQLLCTHRQLAALVNVAPETLCRQLVMFQREGLILRRGPWITLPHAARPPVSKGDTMGSRPVIDSPTGPRSRPPDLR
jgi:CRP-like cAMP-binding protein